MADRVLDFGQTPCYLHVRDQQLVIEPKGGTAQSVPLVEISVIILGHPQVTCTQAVFAGLLQAGAAVVACDAQRMPAGLLLPTAGHCTQTERIAAQASAGQPLRKRAWQQIVKAKLGAQGGLLRELHGTDAGLLDMAKRVRSGDPENLEAQGARRYWPRLFGDDRFRRRRDAPDANRFLNYGYAVLRAATARAICAAGLHPSLGLHHHNRYDAYCLAGDLMEPYRPLVDEAAVDLVDCVGADAQLDPTTKRALLEIWTNRYVVDGETRVLFDVLGRTANSLARLILGKTKSIWYPSEFRRAEA